MRHGNGVPTRANRNAARKFSDTKQENYALDSYHRLNTTNGRLYRENEHLTATNDRLKGENDALRSELKDFRFLRKVLGSQQIDNLIAQAKDMEQQRKQNQRARRRNTNYER